MKARVTTQGSDRPGGTPAATPRDAAQRAELAGFFEQSVDMLCIASVNGYFTALNPAWERNLGWTKEELMAVPYLTFVHQDDLEDTRRQAELLTRPGHQVVSFGNRYRTKSGEWRWLAWTARSSADGTEIYAVAREVPEPGNVPAPELPPKIDTLERVHWLKEAIEEERLLAYSQPIVGVNGGGVFAEELLARVAGDGEEVVCPPDFIPVAEQYGLIQDIDHWMARRAAGWATPERPLAVNLSPRTLCDPQAGLWIEQSVRKAAADPHCLVFEITETALVANLDAARRVVEALARLGCRIALDDFGTGFAGLTYLRDLPAHLLKIDVQFIRHLRDNEDDCRLVKSIVHLAKEFDKQTVAEGVEDEETLEMVADFGVDYAQGYLLGKPSPLGTHSTHRLARAPTRRL